MHNLPTMTCSPACCDEVAHLRATASRLYVALRERQLGDLTTPWFRAKVRSRELALSCQTRVMREECKR